MLCNAVALLGLRPSGTDFWGGVWKEMTKKSIHNVSENSESQKKWQIGVKTWQKPNFDSLKLRLEMTLFKNFNAQNNLHFTNFWIL